MDEDQQGYTPEQLAILANAATVPQEKYNTHSFLHAVATEEDTTKVGYLKEEEVGIPKLSQRTLKELQLYCKNIANEKEWAEYLGARAEILTSTSLSKDAKLLELAVVQRREVADITKPKPKANKGWFKPKQPSQPMYQPQV